MTKKQTQWAITIFVGAVIVVGGVGLLIFHVFWPQVQRLPFFSNNSVISFHEHHQLDPDIPNLIHGRAWLQPTDAPSPFIYDDEMYLPIVFFQEHFDQFLFWDEYAQVLFVTTRDDIVAFYPNQTRFYVNNRPRTKPHPIMVRDGDVFIPASLAEALYPITASYHDAYNLIVVEDVNAPQTTAQLERRTPIRYRPSTGAPITIQAQAGSTVTIFEESEGFTRVRSEEGLLGWVQTSAIDETSTTTPLDYLERDLLLGAFIDNNAHYPPNRTGASVSLAWDVTYVQEANAVLMQTPIHESINVLSPMWFRLDEETMSMTSLACADYVAWAHEHGVEVWPFVFDVNYDNSRAILTNREAREHVIAQILYYVDELGLDGVNIGFEHIRPPEGPYLIQFLRELAPSLRERGVVLSKNVLVPRPYTAFYRRDLMSHTVDFVIVMAYDEHWSAAPTSGPVASISFVQRGIEDLLEQVPANQIVLGLPFYNRIWREVIGDNTLETRRTHHFGTGHTREWFETNYVEWEWLPDIGKYYGEFATLYEDEMVRYRVWLESGRSIEWKLQMYRSYNLAGVAVWNRNFRTNEELWDMMGTFFGE